MKKHAGNVMADLLAGYGVTAVFGIPGGQTLPLYYGIEDNAPKMKHILMRDENNAAMAADAYARISRKIGVCDATAGCGAIKYAAALGEAFNSSSPVLAISAEMSHDMLAARYRGGGAQLVDNRAIMRPITKWQARLPETDKIVEMTEMAVRTAMSDRPGPVYVECPWDLFDKEYTGPAYEADARLASLPPVRSVPPTEDLRAALELLKAARNPVILAGGGAWFSGAKEALKKLAEGLAIPVATSLSGKGILDENHPLSLGVVGALGGNELSEKAVKEADLLFAVGFKFSSNATFNWNIPAEGQKVIHLDIEAVEIGKTAKTEVALYGDAKATLEAMLDQAGIRVPKEIPEHFAEEKKRYLDRRQAEITRRVPILPQQVVSALNGICGDNAILACDASFSCGWAGKYFDVYGERRTLFPRGLSGLGYGLPAGIGAACAKPDAPVVVLTGDGGFTYCLGELATLHEQNLNVKVIVLNNKTLGWIKWYQAAVWDGRFSEVDTMRNDFAAIAKGMGCKGYNLADPDTLEEDLKKILAEPGPAVVDIITTETEACKFTDNPEAVKYICEDHKNK